MCILSFPIPFSVMCNFIIQNAFFDLYTGDTFLFKCGAKDIRALKPKVKGFSSRLKLESSTFRHQ
ncbi:hypothetical protein B6U79_01030 [Candidatus Bathyarchaeota archaeon ex4484_231]|nr:MAG: hypothetical protein B6U79_01030 [Candidatus Bathyarchaeota archaeon ex4484_231]